MKELIREIREISSFPNTNASEDLFFSDSESLRITALEMHLRSAFGGEDNE